MVLLAVGTGIGGAIMHEGRILTGHRGTAGAFGWLSMPGGVPDADHGPWEQVASGRALEAFAAPWGGPGALLAAARTDTDPRAGEAVAAWSRRLGVGTAALAAILDPERIVFAGGMVEHFDLIGPHLRRAHAEFSFPVGRRVPVVPATLGSRAGVVGTLHIAIDPQEVLP